jgi:hypothetical protein
MWRTGLMTWDRSWGGTLTNEHLGLGESDAHVRWIGIRRHQAALVIIAVGVLGDWMVRSDSSVVELVLGITLAACAVPLRDGLTCGEMVVIAVRYRCRSHWHTLSLDWHDDAWVLHARSRVELRGYELEHRGRLDLSGADLVNAERLGAMAHGLATRSNSSHVAVHVMTTHECARTLLSSDLGSSPGEGWRENAQLVQQCIGLDLEQRRLDHLERWSYLRAKGGLVRVLRVREFNALAGGQALLERLQGNATGVSVALHFDVVGGQKAQRIASRAVHQMGSDSAVSRAAGFRRTAKSALTLDRLTQREELVASGTALLRVGVFVTIRAATLEDLGHLTHTVMRDGERSGLRLEKGVGRQSLWFCFQLPGGPGW